MTRLGLTAWQRRAICLICGRTGRTCGESAEPGRVPLTEYLCRMFRLSAVGVATNQEGHRKPSPDRASLHRRWGRGRGRANPKLHPKLAEPSRQKDYTAPSGSSSQLRSRRTIKFRTGQLRRGNTSALPLKPPMIWERGRRIEFGCSFNDAFQPSEARNHQPFLPNRRTVLSPVRGRRICSYLPVLLRD
jgi:hypothetical protein